MVAVAVLCTRDAQRRATSWTSASIAPTAVANESMKRRLVSWITGAGSASNVSWLAYSARRLASGWLMSGPLRIQGLHLPPRAAEPDSGAEGKHKVSICARDQKAEGGSDAGRVAAAFA